MVKIEKKGLDGRSASQSQGTETDDAGNHGRADRRVLRSRYLAVKNLINDERERINADSDKFRSIINEVENLHQLVQKPREQVADAEALLDIANTLVTSVKSQNSEGITPADFITGLLNDFRVNGSGCEGIAQNSISWNEVGITVSHIFRRAPGLCTMLGAMDMELKQRKAVIHRKRTRPTTSTRPEKVEETVAEKKSDTDKNMLTMFDILKRQRGVCLENLVFNRSSFSETVENIFALSFLVKDGRAEINLDDNHNHFVLPRNAPAANMVTIGEVSYSHFVLRFDFKDWKVLLRGCSPGSDPDPCRS
ncbi:unnamed protein product [Victoria cruziana]